MLEQLVKPQLAMNQLQAQDRVRGTKRARQRDDAQTGRRLLVLQPLAADIEGEKPRGLGQVPKKVHSVAERMDTLGMITGLVRDTKYNGRGVTVI